MTPIDQIRKALEAGPTPGVWAQHADMRDCVTFDGKFGAENLFLENLDGYYACQNEKDAAFIAACNPVAIAALLASHDAAVQRAAEMQTLNAKLVEALSFYANPGDYKAPFTGGQGKLYFDCGQTACNAMAENAIVRAAAIRAIKE